MSEEKLNGYVLKDFDNKTYEELEKDYQKLIEDYQTKKYGVQLSQEQIDFITMEVLKNAKWKGTEVYGIDALRKIAVTLEAGKVTLSERESVRALFHFLNQYESKGTKFADVQMKVLEDVSLVVKEINEAEVDLRDASFEMEAKRQGIEPEDLRKAQQNAEAGQSQQVAPQL